jgi:sensor c-di-GMP phosphodiesterase-like protein
MFDLQTVQRGLKEHEFFLEYLPTVALRTNRCVGCEALLRWQHGGRVVPPLDFIPVIEDTPLAGPVTYWVIDAVAYELGAWLREQRDVHISINVPPGLLGHAGLIKAIADSKLLDVIEQLVVEVTERSAPKKIRRMNHGKSKGNGAARIALDDTNMTEASLVTLSQSPIDIVKIDKSSVEELLRDDCRPEKLEILAALLRARKHVIIAEGVETAAQAQRLKELGVEFAQGWHFSTALRARDFKKYFSAHR